MDDSELTCAKSSHGGGIFSDSHHFTVAGGTFNNITKNYLSVPDVSQDFRIIPLGDVNLQRQLRMDKLRVGTQAGVISREARGCVRRVYSAKVEGRKSGITVAIYEGETAEEEWRQDIGKYMAVRHPHILQVYGAASSGGIHATLFHGDLIPYTHFLEGYRFSPILAVYVHGCSTAQFWMTWEYLASRSQSFSSNPKFWIQGSTGQLSIELFSPSPTGNEISWTFSGPDLYAPQAFAHLSPSDQEAIAIRGLSLRDYHATCCSRALSMARSEQISVSATVALAAVMLWSADLKFEDRRQLAYVQGVKVGGTRSWDLPESKVLNMPDGSARYDAAHVLGGTFSLHFYMSEEMDEGIWLSQANHIFHHQITDNFLDHGKYFNSTNSMLISHQATRLGFPGMKFETEITERSWDASVYAGLRQFHAAKGFDPDSQDVARHLGYALYEPSSEIDGPFAYIVDENSPAEVSSSVKDVPPPQTLELAKPSDRLQLSRTSKFIAGIQAALLLFLALCQLYETVR
ncbi:hypothetical protein B0H16DRAFT_1713111 [Mycena metata]|uniref:Uncharacterized protein n=1 Tax=Mycena metata TaxID=1033252 RepID=A0AAD7K267_9AGAR|nr:hypothetical protein B0H16DRAFT_1713111 [Mycena metata]